MNIKKVLITGISGFAGSHLAELLVRNGEFKVYGTYISENSIKNLDNVKENIELIKLNLLDANKINKLFKEIHPDYIYHLAALTNVGEGFKNPALVINNNITSQL